MTATRLKHFLDREGVDYVVFPHAPTCTAGETAQVAHIPPRSYAKAVVVNVDGRPAMAVLPASEKLDTARLAEATDARHVRLALESELDRLFPGCEPGALPPFGNLYGLEVFVSRLLAADGEIAFNAGSHTELVRMAYKDFERLVRPRVIGLSA